MNQPCPSCVQPRDVNDADLIQECITALLDQQDEDIRREAAMEGWRTW